MVSSRKTLCAFSSSSKAKRIKRQASKETFLKWQRSYEREHQALTWLRADTDEEDRTMISTLWCEVCRRYEGRICRKKNFSRHGLMAPPITEQATLLTMLVVSSINQPWRCYAGIRLEVSTSRLQLIVLLLGVFCLRR